MSKDRCPWAGTEPIYVAYHDEEWGIPVYDDGKLFEMLILEGAQAGLSWITILRRREGYRAVFDNFHVHTCANYTDEDLEARLLDPRIIRNRLKVFSVRSNAQAFLKVVEEWGSFSNFLWSYVDRVQVVNHWPTMADLPAHTPLSDRISKDLKKLGFKFVGSTIVYAYMQAVGLVDDHLTTCHVRGE